MSSLPPRPAPNPANAGPTDNPAPTLVLESTAIFGGRLEVVIRHNGRDYRLRHTRLGKLILTA